MKAGATGGATYVYCIVSSKTRVQTTNRPAGPPGTGGVRALEIRPQHYLIVSDARLDEFGEEPLAARLSDLDWVSRAAVAHEAVTESFLTADAVVPMKLFTLFTTDSRALEQVRARWKGVAAVLRRLRKRDEWGVRLVFDESRAPSPGTTSSARSGREYLMAKRTHHETATKRAAEMRRAAAAVVKLLRPLANETRKRQVTAAPESRSRLLLDAAFLVPRSKADRFRAAVERQATKIAPAGYALQVSGPWPPYSFVERG